LLSHQESSECAHRERACDLRRVELDQWAAQPATRVIDHDIRRADSVFHLAEEACHLIGFDGIAGESLRAGLRGQGCEFRVLRAATATRMPSREKSRAREALRPGPAPTISAISGGDVAIVWICPV